MRLPVLLLVAAGACGGSTVVDPDSIDEKYAVGPEYESWFRIDATGEVPGHGDSYRIIYANDIARLFGTVVDDSFFYMYPEGSIIVKEVRELDGDQPGPIKYLGVMRMMNRLDVPDGAELDRPSEVKSYGWLFTYLADDIESDEEYRPACWDECHAAAPVAGAFYDYGR